MIRGAFIFGFVACVAAQGAPLESEKKPAPRSELREQVAPGKTLKFDFPELEIDRYDRKAAAAVKLPAGYEPDKKYPMVVWLGGGDGSDTRWAPPCKFLPEGDFILVGLPFPKGAKASPDSPLVGDFPRMWKYHRFMLDKIAEIIPNIDKSRSIISGFSNGGHTIDGILRSSFSGPKLTDYFNIFILADGGGGEFPGRGSLPRMTGKYVYCCWGSVTETKGSVLGSNKSRSSLLPPEFKAKGATIQASEMKGIGHKFDESEFPKVAKWLSEVALAIPGTPKVK